MDTRKLVMILFLIPLLLTGCNTMKGAGQDVQEAGEEIEDAAD